MFRLVDAEFWDEPQIRALTSDGRLLYICLLTNIHTKPCGIYRMAIDRLAGMVGKEKQIIAAELKRLQDSGLAYYDGTEVCIPGFIRRQHYKGPKIARQIATHLSETKNAEYVALIESRYHDFLRLGGYSRRRDSGLQSKELFSGVSIAAREKEDADMEERIGLLAVYIAEKLKLTGGIKRPMLERLVKAAGGVDLVKAAVDRFAKYYDVVKAERWRHFIIARRFSKFVEFYDSAFASDDVFEAYMEGKRLANAKQDREARRDSSLRIGRHQPVEQKDKWAEFVAALPEELMPLRKAFVAYCSSRKGGRSLMEKVFALCVKEGFFDSKMESFMKQLKPAQRTDENKRRFVLNAAIGTFNIPAIEDEHEQ